MCNRCYLRWWRAAPQNEWPVVTVVERFFAKVDKGGAVPEHAPYLGPCWLWTGAQGDSGHGQFVASAERGTVPAHVFAVELATGDRCPDGMEGCHRCDNPPCVRPSHVYFGTRQQNQDDAWNRHRHPVGSERSASRLTEADVEEIRVRYAQGEPGKWLASEYGIKPCSLYGITSGQKWPQAPGPITRRRKAW